MDRVSANKFINFTWTQNKSIIYIKQPNNLQVRTDLLSFVFPIRYMVSPQKNTKILINETPGRHGHIWPLSRAVHKYSLDQRHSHQHNLLAKQHGLTGGSILPRQLSSGTNSLGKSRHGSISKKIYICSHTHIINTEGYCTDPPTCIAQTVHAWQRSRGGRSRGEVLKIKHFNGLVSSVAP